MLRAVSPAGDPAAVVLTEGLGGGREAGGLDEGAEGRRPWLTQLQQGDVVVEVTRVVVLVHHDATHVRHVLGTALGEHAHVGRPLAWVREPVAVKRSEVMNQM